MSARVYLEILFSIFGFSGRKIGGRGGDRGREVVRRRIRKKEVEAEE